MQLLLWSLYSYKDEEGHLLWSKAVFWRISYWNRLLRGLRISIAFSCSGSQQSTGMITHQSIGIIKIEIRPFEEDSMIVPNKSPRSRRSFNSICLFFEHKSHCSSETLNSIPPLNNFFRYTFDRFYLTTYHDVYSDRCGWARLENWIETFARGKRLQQDSYDVCSWSRWWVLSKGRIWITQHDNTSHNSLFPTDLAR